MQFSPESSAEQWQDIQAQAAAHLAACGGDRLPEPRRVGGTYAQPVQVEFHSQSKLGAENWRTPMHVQQPLIPQVGQHVVEGTASEMERVLERQQLHAEQQRNYLNMAQMVQMLQYAASQGITGEAQASNVASGEEPFNGHQRIDELNHYIRQQAQEYIEGQAEWSRQIAEVKSECLRELEKCKRDKEEVERQARQEILRLQQLLREVGVKEEVLASGNGQHNGQDSPSARSIGSWAAGVSMEEHQQAHRKWKAAEDRIRELEQYIKDQSAKQLLSGDAQVLKEKDEQLQKLQQTLAASGTDLRQANSEVQALRVRHQQKVHFWEQSTCRLLATAEQFLSQSQRNLDRGSETEELENGRFSRTATKVSLTLSQGEGGDVGSLRRALKDCLKNGKERGAKKAPQKSAEESKAESTPPDAQPEEQPKGAD
eukprot:CAMPEP_0179263560 /NCGR_PEP_ID=MMETSP0797-20121207/27941_1 /TAXON_ID=47934 /ORGANISM="Dinophysis acuminata, Strain DAEP01" /LENGTH=427 /DNA_ID=CAMNT_0020971721 /DNA_START=26 /DNA_END=1306 /DNA_ORIENTATION=+